MKHVRGRKARRWRLFAIIGAAALAVAATGGVAQATTNITVDSGWQSFITAGGVGGASIALERLERGLDRLSPRARERLALENDDRCFTPRDLMPLCERTGVPLVYDVHHHRCLPDGYSVGEATKLAFATWGDREPYAHLSSPREGWAGPNVRAHADYIDPSDFPEEWLSRTMTIDIEAKAKERAVVAIKEVVSRQSPVVSFALP